MLKSTPQFCVSHQPHNHIFHQFPPVLVICLYDSAAHPSLPPYHPCSIVHLQSYPGRLSMMLCAVAFQSLNPSTRQMNQHPSAYLHPFPCYPWILIYFLLDFFISTTNPWTVPVWPVAFWSYYWLPYPVSVRSAKKWSRWRLFHCSTKWGDSYHSVLWAKRPRALSRRI